MSQALNADYYVVSDTSDDDLDADEVDISDITGSIDLNAIQTYLLSQRPPDPQPLGNFRTPQSSFNTYIPEWMDPRVRSRPIRHPALRPDDTWQVGDDWVFPSEYAKRWGVDPRAPADNPGRSMLTPNTHGPDMDWTEDFQAVVFHGFTADELKAQGAFDPDMQIDGSVQGLANSPLHPLVRRSHWRQPAGEGFTPDKSLLWYNYNGEDRIWNATTNDQVWDALQPVLQLMSKVLYSNHPFWASIMDICKLRPVDPSRFPRLPPNAPMYISLMSLDNSGNFVNTSDQALDPVQAQNGAPAAVPPEMWSRMSTLHYEVEDRHMYPEAKALRDSGFQSARVGENILRAYLTFRFGDTVRLGAYATTLMDLDMLNPNGPQEIVVTISPESVWPLILPTYSKSEKFVLATALATIMLHELAHCARDTVALMTEVRNWETNPALRTARPDDDSPIAPELTQLTAQQKQLLLQLGAKIGSADNGRSRTTFPAFFFQDEFRAEEGWAFENQLWGGVMNTMSGIEPRDGFPQVTSWLQQWPYAMAAPRPWFRAGWTACGEFDNLGWPTWLLDPPPTLIDRQTALPVTMMSRLYDEAFWASDFAKFSHMSLRYAVHQWQGRPLRSSFFYNFIPLEVLQRSFANHTAYPWLAAAHAVLTNIGEPALATWLQLRTVAAAAPAVARRRFHYERRRWLQSDAAARGKAADLDRLVADARAALARYRAADDASVEQLLRRAAYLELAARVADAGLDVARQAGWEVSSLQFSVSECGRLEPPARRRVLARELDLAGARARGWIGPFVALAVAAVAEVQLELDVSLGQDSSSSSVGGAGVQVGQRRVIAARVDAAHRVLVSTAALVEELGQVVDELTSRAVDNPPGGQGEGEGEGATRYTFALLAERSSDRLHRNRVERLAQHRLRGLAGGSPVLAIVTAAGRILERC